MSYPRCRSRLISALLSATLMLQSISCGSILYPERIGQPHGPLDPTVVALDTVGLLLFVVPGAIAFAVDFYNGTIYLPANDIRCQSPESVAPQQWVSRKLDSTIKSRADLEEYLKQQTGESIELQDGNLNVFPLDAAPTTAPVEFSNPPEPEASRNFEWERFFRLGSSDKKPRS